MVAYVPFESAAAGSDAYISLRETVGLRDMRMVHNIVTKWRRDGYPPVPEAVAAILEKTPLRDDDRILIAALRSLAAEPHGNPFHNSGHFLEVFLLTAVMGAQTMHDARLSARNFRNLMAAALIHDYHHDGGGNGSQQFRLESMAFEHALPSLQKAGFSEDDCKDIRALLYATDASKDFSDPKAVSPAESLKRFVLSADINQIHPELQRLVESRIIDAGLTLHEADIGVGLLSPKLTLQGSEFLAKELNIPFSPNMSVFFLDKICMRQTYSYAGSRMLRPFLKRTLRAFGLELAPSALRPL